MSQPARSPLIKRLGSAIDAMIEAVAPGRALRRHADRELLSYAHRAAARDRTTDDWFASRGSADADILADLPTMRERARELVRNTGVASGAEQAFVDNVVGRGIRPQASIAAEQLGVTPERARELELEMESCWNEWAPAADSQNRMSIYEIMQLVVRANFHDGESLLLRNSINDSGRAFNLAFEVIEADRLETPAGLAKGTDRIKYRDGIRLGDRGQPVRYYIRKNHPGDAGLGYARGPNLEDYLKLPPRDEFGRPVVLHPYLIKRPGQSRGVPWISTTAADFQQLREYMDAERMAKRIEACHAVFEIAPPGVGGRQYGEAQQSSSGIRRVQPGEIRSLSAGSSVGLFHPTRPGNSFAPYLHANYREIGCGLGISILSLLRDYTNTNYSSARAALLGDRKTFLCIVEWMVFHLCQPIYELLAEEAWARGRFAADLDFLNLRYWLTRCDWVHDGWEWIDPVKEANAESISVKLGVRSRTQICRAKGTDFEAVTKQLEREEEMRDEAGLADEESEPADTKQEGAPEEKEEEVAAE